MENDEQESSYNIEDMSDEERQSFVDIFELANTFYVTFEGCIPQEEKSTFKLGDDFFSTLNNCGTAVFQLSDDLEAYCALFALTIACRGYRLRTNIEDVDPGLTDDLDRNRRIIDITEVVSIVEHKIERIEDLELPSGRQIAILQISYLILAEAELSAGDPEALAVDFIKDACRLDPIEFRGQNHTYDQQLRMVCLQMCGTIELFPKVVMGRDYIWDLTDKEWLHFWSALIRTNAIQNSQRMSAGIPERLLNEILALLPLSPLDGDTLGEAGWSDSFNDSLRDLLELPELFRNDASETDILPADEPRNSDPNGSAYWCWMSGQLIGIVAKSSGQVGINNILSDSSWFDGGISARMMHGSHLFSLFSECVDQRDWSQFKHRCMQAWASLPQDKYSNIDEITPATRSYWAMRIGICDAYLDASIDVQKSPTLLSSPALEEPTNSYSWSVADERFTPEIAPRLRSFSPDELRKWNADLRETHISPSREFVTEQLGDVLTKLDSPKVRRLLNKGELLYQNVVDDIDVDNAKITFTRAIEGAFLYTFTNGFIEFLKKRGNRSTNIVFAGKRREQSTNIKKIRKFGLGEWSDAFAALLSTNQRRSLAWNSDLGQYLEPLVGQNSGLDLSSILRELEKIQKPRNSASHFNEHEMLEEESNLKKLRDISLGIERKSPIENFIEWFQPIDDSN